MGDILGEITGPIDGIDTPEVPGVPDVPEVGDPAPPPVTDPPEVGGNPPADDGWIDLIGGIIGEILGPTPEEPTPPAPPSPTPPAPVVPDIPEGLPPEAPVPNYGTYTPPANHGSASGQRNTFDGFQYTGNPAADLQKAFETYQAQVQYNINNTDRNSGSGAVTMYRDFLDDFFQTYPEVPQFQVNDQGQNVYLDVGTDYFRKGEVGGTGGHYGETDAIGTYSQRHVNDDTDLFETVLNNPVFGTIGNVITGGLANGDMNGGFNPLDIILQTYNTTNDYFDSTASKKGTVDSIGSISDLMAGGSNFAPTGPATPPPPVAITPAMEAMRLAIEGLSTGALQNILQNNPEANAKFSTAIQEQKDDKVSTQPVSPPVEFKPPASKTPKEQAIAAELARQDALKTPEQRAADKAKWDAAVAAALAGQNFH